MEEAKEMIQEEREEFMVSNFGKPVKRIAHFLTPTTNTIQNVSTNPNSNNPPSSKSNLEPQNLQQQQVTVIYNGWRKPPSKWKIWVHHLTPKFQSLWKEAGIYEAIMCSTLNIKKDYDLLLSLPQKWNPTTNTFVFPWGEATLTLEDVLILGGYSVTGLHFFPPFFHNADLEQIENCLKNARRLSREAGGRQIDAWLNALMKSGSEFEHEAFLSYWLANFLFPTLNGVIKDNVFSIAVRLAQGTRFAIAPAVLACIYSDLRLLKHTLDRCSSSKSRHKLVLNLYSSFQLVQLWAWERFRGLCPIPKTICHTDPRAARWEDVKNVNISDIKVALDCAVGSFLWRPYAIVQIPRFNKEKEEWVHMKPDKQEKIICLVLCLRVSELVGIGKKCIELYLPHRVAMQFGFDQDVPMQVDQCHDITAEIAWYNYARALNCSSIYIPSLSVEAGVSVKYMEWWSRKNVDGLAGFSMERKISVNANTRVCPEGVEISSFHEVCEVLPHRHQNESENRTGKEHITSDMIFPTGFGPNSVEPLAIQLSESRSKQAISTQQANYSEGWAYKPQTHPTDENLDPDVVPKCKMAMVKDSVSEKFPMSEFISTCFDNFKTLSITQVGENREDPRSQAPGPSTQEGEIEGSMKGDYNIVQNQYKNRLYRI
ncbi:hypothetical protein ACFE04_023192 [Oxalis oulophora]